MDELLINTYITKLLDNVIDLTKTRIVHEARIEVLEKMLADLQQPKVTETNSDSPSEKQK